MINHHGDVQLGKTLYGYFSTHDDTGANVAPSSALEAADVIVYEEGSATQITAGITVTSPFDAETGFHKYEIDTSNAAYSRGKQYSIILAPDETVDSAAITAIPIGEFSTEITPPVGGWITDIATWTSNADFTLTDGPAADDALNGYTLVVKAVEGDEAEKYIQILVTDYTGSTKTVAGTVTHGNFTAAASDWVAVIPAVDVHSIAGTAAAAAINTQVDTALTDIGLDHILSASVAGTDVADDSLWAQLVSSSATADYDDYDNETDSMQALRDRGDAAWTTGGGGSIAHIISWVPFGTLATGYAIDLANTKSVRGGLVINNMLDDLPTSAAEITPGTYTIERAAQGATGWSSVVTSTALTEADGLVYFDEVFDSGTGYAAGDVIRIGLQSIEVTTSEPNTYEIIPASGVYYYINIIETTPDVNIASISDSTAAADVLELFALALDGGTGQIDAGTFSSDAITATKIQDGALTSGKFAADFLTAAKIADDAFIAANFAADVTTEFQNGLATSAEITALDTVVDRVETDTQDIQSRLPAALSSNGNIVADVQEINAVPVVGDGSTTPYTV